MQGVIGTTWGSALSHTKMYRWQLASWELLRGEGGLLLSEWLLAPICVLHCVCAGVVLGTVQAVRVLAYYFTGALAAFWIYYYENLPNRMFWPVNSDRRTPWSCTPSPFTMCVSWFHPRMLLRFLQGILRVLKSFCLLLSIPKPYPISGICSLWADSNTFKIWLKNKKLICIV